jgi:uncharacterized protein
VSELLQGPARQVASLEETAARPWPLPDDAWVLAQTLEHVLLAHWRVPAGPLRSHLPEGVELDELDGSAWLTVAGFAVSDLRARGLLPLPYVSRFRQLNVRTYVTGDDRPGIWLFSCDATSRLVVEAARRLYGLPFFGARISLERMPNGFVLESVRDEQTAFSGTFEPEDTLGPPRPGSREHFLTERYCVYVERGGKVQRADVHHRPWSLRAASAALDLNTMAPAGLTLEGEPAFHYARRQDMLVWPARPVS